MSVTTAMVLLAVGLLIVMGLAGYALTLRKEVKRREASLEEEQRRAITNSLENLDHVVSALSQQQVDITEGSWRCKVLLEIIDVNLTKKPDFQAFSEVYERTRHLKTHSARNRLSPRERHQEDKERLTVEREMHDDVMAAARAVIEWRRKGGGALH